MTKIEKQMIVGIIICILAMAGSCSYLAYRIEQEGGFKQVIINTGKEIKDISREITKD